jgi:hypothetical protein
MMRALFSTCSAIILSATLFSGFASARSALSLSDAFPRGPRIERTPGAVCISGNSFRYPEHVRYCERDVDPVLKYEIIRAYDNDFGYSIHTMRRGDFKIDHYIPLCAGGSNDESNLWPQHESVYKITDPLEPLVCEKMAAGRLTQAAAINFIREAKNDLSKAAAIIDHVQAL